MKKIFFFALALLATLQFAGAQDMVKKSASAKAAVESAQEAANNPKKNTKLATWTKLGQTLVNAYNAPLGSGWLGASKEDLNLLMRSKRPAGPAEDVVIGGNQFNKVTYATCEYYFGANGQLAAIKVTKPAVENALERALDAYKEAAKLDPANKKSKDIIDGLTSIVKAAETEAYSLYTLGDLAAASKAFELAAVAGGTAPMNDTDYSMLFNAGYTSVQNGDYARGKDLLEKCVAAGHLGDEGAVYSNLAEAYDKLGDKDSARETLEKAIQAFPQSQSVLIGLINYYVSNNVDPEKLFSLLDVAKKNEPGNASLYYVEGQVRSQLGDIEGAAAAYDKSLEIDPNYVHGYVGKGLMLYNYAVKLQEEAQNEMDDAKYLKLAEAFEKSLKDSIVPFEKAYEMSQDPEMKKGIADYLKSACFRFRSDPEYMAKYEKYNATTAD